MKELIAELAKQIGAAVRDSLGSWARTARLCCLVVATGVAFGVYALIGK